MDILNSAVLSRFCLIVFLSIFGVADAANGPAPSEIFDIRVVSEKPNEIQVEIDYFYNGEDGHEVTLAVMLETSQKIPKEYSVRPMFKNVFRGRNKVIIVVNRNQDVTEAYVTETIRAALASYKTRKSAEKVVAHVHKWPSIKPDPKDPKHQDAVLRNAITIIDTTRNLSAMQNAEKMLGDLISINPRKVQAYIELARIKMKTDGTGGHDNSEGVLKAEKYLNIALKIDPEYADTYVLLGYVYAVKGQTGLAKEVLKKAEKMGTRNMWLYFNWGLAYRKEKDEEGALRIYMKGIDSQINMQDPNLKSHNRAVKFIFDEAIEIMGKKKDWDSLEKVHKRRVKLLEDYCSIQNYARFLVLHRSNYQEALRLQQLEVKQACSEEGQLTLAIGYLAKWADRKITISEAERQDLYFKAMGIGPNTQTLLLTLASSDYASEVIRLLQHQGVNIDEKDIKGFNALAHTAYDGDVETAIRLIRYGANLQQRYPGNWTLLMLAAQGGNAEMIRFLLSKGQSKDVKSAQGWKAADIARLYGHQEIADLLANTKV